jgi:hypothetical protein
MTIDLSTIAYAGLNLDFNEQDFIKEYDERIIPHGTVATNGRMGISAFGELNKKWGMVHPDLYDTGDIWEQTADGVIVKYLKRDRPAWKMVQLMQTDLTSVTNPHLIAASKGGGQAFRNSTLDLKYKFHIKPQYEDLKIWKWLQETLPFEKINGVHCTSIEPGGFGSIHRDAKGLYNNKSSAGVSKVFKMGYIVINLNISNGGVPLYWSLDGKDSENVYKADRQIYITNDYFLHGVPIVSSRRRQIRVIGIPKPEMWDLIDHTDKVDIGANYEFSAPK